MAPNSPQLKHVQKGCKNTEKLTNMKKYLYDYIKIAQIYIIVDIYF